MSYIRPQTSQRHRLCFVHHTIPAPNTVPEISGSAASKCSFISPFILSFNKYLLSSYYPCSTMKILKKYHESMMEIVYLIIFQQWQSQIPDGSFWVLLLLLLLLALKYERKHYNRGSHATRSVRKVFHRLHFLKAQCVSEIKSGIIMAVGKCRPLSTTFLC